jgi:undecaprenyl-diphosphatase
MRARQDQTGPTDRAIVIIALSIAAVGTAFTVVVSRSELLPGEVAIARWVDTTLSGLLGPASGVLDVAFTDAMAPTIFLALVPVVAMAWGRLAAVIYFVAGAATGLTKLADLVARPRPTEDLEWGTARFGNGGYPSGHVVYVVLVFGTIAYLASVHETDPRVRRAVVAGSAALIVITAPARVVELDHWPADVVGGYLIALPGLLIVIWVHRRAPVWIAARAPVLAWLLVGRSGVGQVAGELADDGLDRGSGIATE